MNFNQIITIVSFLATGALVQGQEFEYTMFFPRENQTTTEGKFYHNLRGMMSPDAPEGNSIESRAEMCVSANEGMEGVMEGVYVMFAGAEKKIDDYCIKGWSQRPCMGQFTYVITHEVPSQDGFDFPLGYPQELHALFKDFQINATETFSNDESDYYQFSNYVPIMSVSIDKGKCPED